MKLNHNLLDLNLTHFIPHRQPAGVLAELWEESAQKNIAIKPPPDKDLPSDSEIKPKTDNQVQYAYD